MNNRRLFKIIIKDEGGPSKRGLKYIYDNLDIINEMGIQVKISVIEADSLDRETVNILNSKGITSFPSMITDNGKTRNGLEEISELFERNKKNYLEWIDQQNEDRNRNRNGGDNLPPAERGPEYDFGSGGKGINGDAMTDGLPQPCFVLVDQLRRSVPGLLCLGE